MDALAGFWYCP